MPRPPQWVANAVDSFVGKLAIFALCLYFFLYCGPVVAILFLVVAYQLWNISANMTGLDALKEWVPSEEKKSSQFTAFNQFPYTLEQEQVAKWAPVYKTGISLTETTYRPKLDNTHDAAPVHLT